MGLHNPLPSSLASECLKCANILESFIDPRQAFGPDKIIPPVVLENAKGLAILTVIKAGFLGSARFGSGLVVARRDDGSWSAPSAIGTVGAGIGGQIGFELTDFVFILNDLQAVKTFAQAGSITLGGNVSVAAGPVGRNAEAAGAASLKSVAAIFSYSKTKGLFAGVSLEGSAIIERRDANEKLYGQRYRAIDLLDSVPPPPQAEPLLRILHSRGFNSVARDASPPVGSPVVGEQGETVWDADGTAGISAARGGGPSPGPGTSTPANGFGSSRRSSSWRADADGERRVPPPRPTAPKPIMVKSQAIAMFTFEAAETGDLGFSKGDVIEVLKKTDSENDWWTGKIGDKQGIFPSNYVKIKE